MSRSFIIRVVVRAVLLAACVPAVAVADERLSLDLGGGMTMELAKIPAGTFLMGSPDTEQDRQPNEGPQHEVTISKPFYMGVHPVTSEQFKQVTGGMQGARMIGGPQYPVVGMSYDTVVAFCKTLSEKTGRVIRLPTEAEREYACRAGTTTRYPYGDDPEYAQLGDYAWYDKNAEHKDAKGNAIRNRPVGMKKPNPWGLHDMLGNVFEYCSDISREEKNLSIGYESDAPATDPTGPQMGDPGTKRGLHVVRGNSWHLGGKNFAPYCRSASRRSGNPDQSVGFRVVVEE